MSALEDLIGTAVVGAFGSPLILALFGVIFFIAIVAFFGLGLDGAIVIMIPAFMFLFTAVPTLSPLKILFGLAAGLLFAFMLLRIMSHR